MLRASTQYFKYEELLGILIDHKWTFDDHLFRYCAKTQAKNTQPGINIKVHASKEADKYHKSISCNLHIIH